MPAASSLRIAQITPGAGKMFCGACLRDNALVTALRRQGHAATMTPLYLPLTLDEADQSAGEPLFYGGINVYLEQHSSFFRSSPEWLHHLLASPALLKLAAGPATRTRPENLGDITLSMLRGEGREIRPVNWRNCSSGCARKNRTRFVSPTRCWRAWRVSLRAELRVPVLLLFAGRGLVSRFVAAGTA